ncbi:MAG: class I SAM-dependent methyltransferase [Limisphaerales bacterium]
MTEEKTLNGPRFEQLKTVHFEETCCPVCGSRQETRNYQKRIRSYTMRYATCAACGSIYANPRATAESLRNIYASEDFFEGKGKQINYFSFIRGEPYLVKTARSRLRRIQKFAKGADLLEIASAAGFFLKEAKAAGLNVNGVEISAPMARWASQQWDVPIRAESIEEIDLPDNRYDVVASWGVFTILRDPNSVMRKVYRSLRPGGVFALNTYYSESLWGRLWKKNWYILVLNTSQILSRSALMGMFRSNGFEVVSMRRDRPYASVQYLLFQLLNHLPFATGEALFNRIRFLNRWVFPVIAPDNYEYICVKK